MSSSKQTPFRSIDGTIAWALPVMITPIPLIVQNRTANVTYNIVNNHFSALITSSDISYQTSCYFDDPAFSIVSLVFTLVPLAVAITVSAVMVAVVWRNSDTMLERSGWLFVKTKRFARFAALVSVTMVSASLYAVVLAQWTHNHHSWRNNPTAWLANRLWVNSVRASVIWEGKWR